MSVKPVQPLLVPELISRQERKLHPDSRVMVRLVTRNRRTITARDRTTITARNRRTITTKNLHLVWG